MGVLTLASLGLGPDLIIDLFVSLVCLVFSALFSASETAITSLGTLKTKHLLESRPKDRIILTFWLENPGRVLTTILTVNNLVNILASAIITKIAIQQSHSYAIAIATGITTFFILVFGEIIPKSFAKAQHEWLAISSLRFVYFFYQLLSPFVIVLSEAAAYIIHKLGGKDTSIKPAITEEELEFFINEGESAGVIEDYKKEMISGVFDFDETKVREIMTPRTDIVAIEKHEPIENAVKICIQTGHSRLPVYEGSLDMIVGIVFAKDLLRMMLTEESNKENTVTSLMREPFFQAESKSNIDVFKDLKKSKNHLAIVVDEHGGTAGIVTMEDILEEIVGEIQDEFDLEKPKILPLGPEKFDVAGSFHIGEFIEYFDLDEDLVVPEDLDVDTIGGFIMQQNGAMPKVGQTVDFGPLRLKVSEITRNRVERILVTRPTQENLSSTELKGSISTTQ